MQVIATPSPFTRSDRLAIARSAMTAALLVLAGVALFWLCLGTSFVTAFIPSGRPSTAQSVVSVIAWAFVIVVPAGLTILGVARFLGLLDTVSALKPRRVTRQLASSLGPDHLAATDLLLPGGRRLHELVLGPFGIVVLAEVPPPSLSRHVGTRWEIKDERGRWISIEAPLDRAARDAERVRGWLGSHDRDFLVRVYAAVVSDDPRVERTATCAVISPSELALWLEALPVQRGLTPERRASLMELIRSVANGR